MIKYAILGRLKHAKYIKLISFQESSQGVTHSEDGCRSSVLALANTVGGDGLDIAVPKVVSTKGRKGKHSNEKVCKKEVFSVVWKLSNVGVGEGT